MRARLGQLALAAGVALLGALVLWGGLSLATSGGYAQVGPGVVPRIVGAGILLLAALLLREVLTGGLRALDEEAEARVPMDWPAFGWVTAGILAYGLAIEAAGFILASALLFVLVARGFYSRRWLWNLAVGLVLGAIVFAIFNYGLGLTLPAGVLRGIL